MNEHQTTKVLLDGKYEDVDNEMTDIIVELNRLGFRTSGCCIGKENTDSAWIIIQEINENRIIGLMSALKETEYIITKDLYLRNKIVYVQWFLTTPKFEYSKRVDAVKLWADSLKNRKLIKGASCLYLNNECKFK